MVASKKLQVAFRSPASVAGYTTIESYLESTHNPDFRILRMIADAMKFDFEAVTYDTDNKLRTNGSLTGAIGLINSSKVDIIPELFMITEERMDMVHFCYPFRLYSSTFVIEKPEYTPQIFGMIKPFSINVWLTLTLFAIVIVGLKSMSIKRKHSLHDVILDTLAICFNQSTIVKSRTLSQHLLTYSWISGTMFLGFCYASVLLSFLTIPPVQEIRTIRDLAEAVINNGYSCMCDSYVRVGPTLMAESKIKSMVILGRKMLSDSGGFGKLADFLRMKGKKIAYFNVQEAIPYLPTDYYFVSDDTILEGMAAMIVLKDFCCKKQVDAVIHRIMAAGLHAKVKRDTAFLSSLKFEYGDPKINSVRKLTLKDFLLPFMILLIGYFCSFIGLLVEVVFCSSISHNR